MDLNHRYNIILLRINDSPCCLTFLPLSQSFFLREIYIQHTELANHVITNNRMSELQQNLPPADVPLLRTTFSVFRSKSFVVLSVEALASRLPFEWHRTQLISSKIVFKKKLQINIINLSCTCRNFKRFNDLWIAIIVNLDSSVISTRCE
mgnify:CR=1 FL=1